MTGDERRSLAGLLMLGLSAGILLLLYCLSMIPVYKVFIHFFWDTQALDLVYHPLVRTSSDAYLAMTRP